jgi:hypothetical protein
MKKKTGESAALAIGAGRKNRATSTGGEQGGGAGGAAVTPPRPRAEGTVVTRSAAKEGERVAREEAVSTHTRSHKKKAAEE